MPRILEGRRALVTGAASGCGQAVAKLFAAEGAHVAVHARTTDRASETMDLIAKDNGKALAVAADLAVPAEIEQMCKAAVDGLGGLDIVVNVAGVITHALVEDMSVEEWDWVMNTNLRAQFLVSKYTVPAMTSGNSRGRRYVFVSSLSGKFADPAESAYCASKAGIITFARCFAAEMGKHGITSNVVAPGWFETKMAKDIVTSYAEQQQRSFDEVYDETMKNNMLREKLMPEDMANAVLFFCTDRARNITAQTLNVCGGLCFW